ncbi:hypothetical protein B9Z65_5015 [Elsinoe australis]|uniref:Uncharacterized protein n=1 Tax=Elsinoe australis TaxID=40998 RepID=A0A2P7ZCT8_9PEZI|nr:hypothetical protein B9Z65_5015 [Elsinoe australis]
MAFKKPMHAQQSSRLLQLPAELLNHIITLSLTTKSPIFNPVQSSSSPAPSNHFSTSPYSPHSIPSLGSSLPSTCQMLHSLTPPHLLLSNTPTFTRPSLLLSFLSSLPISSIPHIHNITISLSETSLLHTSSPSSPSTLLLREWTHFLSCPSTSHAPSVWCSPLPTLTASVPWLQHLTIDLEGCALNTSAEMAFMGIKTGYAAAMEGLLRGLGRRGSKGRGLKSVQVTGKGAHLWDLGEMVRPTCWGEWETVGAWVERVWKRVVPFLIGAVGGMEGREVGRRDSGVELGVVVEGGEKGRDGGEGWGDGVVRNGDGSEGQWVGMLWTGNRFSLAGLEERPSEKTLRRMGFEHAVAWDEVLRMTADKERIGHPVFALFV